MTSRPVASDGSAAIASETFCSWFCRIASACSASIASKSPLDASFAAGVLVQDPRRDQAHELLGGHLRYVRRALEGDGVAQEQHVDDADERARAVLVLAHDGALGAEEVDALHLEEVPVVVVLSGSMGRGGHLGAVALTPVGYREAGGGVEAARACRAKTSRRRP